MIAYKPFAICPISQRPAGIPMGVPWIQQTCSEEQAHILRKQGWSVLSAEEYDTYVASLTDELAAWEAAKVQLGIEAVVSDAAIFGQGLMVSFAAENVLLGITQDNMTGLVLDRLSGVMSALQAGSLYEAINRIKSISILLYDSKYITAARLLVFCNKIETYLGIPLSTTL